MSKNENSPNNYKNKEENSNSFLNRKTKRDNNGNPSLEQINLNIYLPNEIRCSICLEYEKFSTKCYKCIKCSSYFHLACYNLFNFTEDKTDEIKNNNNLNHFICTRCKEDEKIKCCLCMEHSGIIKKTADNKYKHYYCYILEMNIDKTTLCKFCKKREKPTIKCHAKKCKFKCHIKCGIEQGLIFSIPFLKNEFNKDTFFDPILFLCENHNDININAYLEKINKKENIKSDNNINAINDNLINEKDNNATNLNNNNKENNENENESNNNSDNYESNNDIEEDSNKTPPNDFSLEKEISNENNSISNNNINTNGNTNNNIMNENNNIIKKEDKKENLNNNNQNKNINNINNENNIDEEISIKMNIKEENKKENNSKECNNTNKMVEEEDEKEVIKIENSQKSNLEKENEIKEKEISEISEIKHEKINLYENFKKMNEDYYFPGSFFKFHLI